MNKLKEVKGITLIALVITIIVLLILAGVSIATLLGENGILTKAKAAKIKTENSSEEEQRILIQVEAAMNFEEFDYKDSNNKTVKIPEGCAVSKVEGENTVDSGLVIIDKNGNEWVWIEVPKSVTDGKTTVKDIETALQTYTSDVITSRNGYADTYYVGCGYANETDYNIAKEKMLNGIKNNGGFYIGKYEVGIKENTVRSFGTDCYKEHSTEGQTPVIQANKYPYNWVTQSQAQILSTSLSIGRKTSSLMFGIQWDLVLKHLSVATEGKTVSELTSDSSSWGNYSNISFDITRGAYSTNKGVNWTETTLYTKPSSGVLLTTGATKRNSSLNIYDLAGNVWERTLEKTSNFSNPCADRGGIYYGVGIYSASSRGGYDTTYNGDSIGFRSTLF